MHILIFSPILSHPQNEGNCKRIFTLTKYLQTLGHTIHFVYFTQSGLSKKSFDSMLNEWDTLTIIEKTKSYKVSTTGYKLDEWYQDDIHIIVNDVIETFEINVLLVNYVMQSKLLEYVPKNILKIIDTHDIFADRHTIYNNKNCRPYTWYSISKEDEIRALNRADTIIAIQKEEADYFSTVTNVPVKLINHLESKHFLNRSYSSLKKIGFIGSGNHINDHSINEFLKKYITHPISHTDIQIIIAGKVCDKIKVQHENIILQGIVENLKDFYNEVDLIINPLTFGTGLKIKSIEALAYGVPIVSTKVGFEGIGTQHPYHKLNSISEMIDSIHNINITPSDLTILGELSKKIFETYEHNVKYEIENLFENYVHSEVYNDMHEKMRNKNTIITKLYRQTQMLKFSIHKHEHERAQVTQANNLIFKSIRSMIRTSIIKNPLKKYRAYKTMLETYFKIRKSQ